jgi:basic membrane lipoprotein Med (substrate-binding protein (PBP1-ABC) superfamily)/streptogramin lyase
MKSRLFSIFVVSVLLLSAVVGSVSAGGLGTPPFSPDPPVPDSTPHPAMMPTTPLGETGPHPLQISGGQVALTSIKVGVVLDQGGASDQGFGQSAWEGAQKAATEFGWQAQYLVSSQIADYETNIDQFATTGYNIIITVGFMMGDATAAKAKQYPGIKFAIVDNAYFPTTGSTACPGTVTNCYVDGGLTNVTSLMFQEDQVGFLAGVVAAGMSHSGTICSVSGMEIPPVVRYVSGYQAGAKWMKPTTKSLNVYIPSFVDPTAGHAAGVAMINQGCDVIFGVGGNTGNGGLLAAKEHGLMAIGVDVDQYNTYPEVKTALLTSALKNVDVAVYEYLKGVNTGTDQAGIIIANINNDGVGLAPYHDWDSRIPDAVKTKVKEATAALKVGVPVVLGQPGTSFRSVATVAGVTEEAYPADTQYLNGPNGLFIDGSDNLFVTEELGDRLLKFRLSDKTNRLSIGTAGLQNRGTYTFDRPKDITVDSDGNIWAVDNQRAVEYTSTGTFIQEFPAADPWNSGSDNSHFNEPRSIAFDTAGRMYIADRNNHRVQVYTMGGPTPVYSTTLGVTGQTGTDDTHFNEPTHLAFDSLGRLYVLDKNNYRVQRCTYAANVWTCSRFFGETGVPGTDASHLSQFWISGLTIKGSTLFIADTGNNRVLKCNLSGVCNPFAGVLGEWGSDSNHLSNPGDVAVDSTGNVYVSDYANSRIQKFASGGGAAVDMLGTTHKPYEPDTTRYNMPFGVAVGADGSLVFTEYAGFRLVKLNAAGTRQWTVGQAGVWMWNADNTHFGDPWDGPMAVAVARNGLIYVADTGSHRVLKCTAAGVCSAFAGVSGSNGSDATHLDRPAGVAVDLAGNVYIGDRNNHRVQKCTPAGICTTFAGVTGESGSNDTHFSGPMGVTVDSSGNVYVADAWNNRVQKCTAGGSCSTFAGVTGAWGSDFAHLGEPRDIAVDAQGRVYVADIANNRVQVFDVNGAYLTTIGGSYGIRSSELRNPSGVDVDSLGNVYIVDSTNHRLQKFAPGVTGWRQMNLNGFGDRSNNTISRMQVFGSDLYAGADNSNTGGEVWRSGNGTTWSQVNLDGFGLISNTAAHLGQVFNGQLYVGTLNETMGAELWRCTLCDGSDWDQVVSGGFGDAANTQIEGTWVLSNTLYATTNNVVTGAEVWKSSTGNSGLWTQANIDGFGNVKNTGLWTASVLNGYLYVATGNYNVDAPTGVEVWRTNGTTWEPVNAAGFGDTSNTLPWLEAYNGYLYIGLNTGQIRRCALCNGSDWDTVMSGGFGHADNWWPSFMFSFNNDLYATIMNYSTGAEIWRTSNGTEWQPVSTGGLGNSNNAEMWTGAAFNNALYLGTNNGASGGEIWQLLKTVFVPLVTR